MLRCVSCVIPYASRAARGAHAGAGVPATISDDGLRGVRRMSEVVRFSVSTDERLLDLFDAVASDKGYVNRSEAVRDLMRDAIVEEEWRDESMEAAGTVTLVYDHHASDLSERLTRHQHDHHEVIETTLHVHLNEHRCLEVIVLRGRVADIKRLADSLIGTKGVKHGKFVATTLGESLT